MIGMVFRSLTTARWGAIRSAVAPGERGGSALTAFLANFRRW